MSFHDVILDKLLEYREKNTEFYFLMRQRDTKNRYAERFWFQGTEKYAFVGLIDASGAPRPTRSVGLGFKPTGTQLECWMGFAFSGETDQDLIRCYQSAIEKIGGFEEKSKGRYIRHIGELPNDDFSALDAFLNLYYPVLIDVFKKHNQVDVLVSEQKFNASLENIMDLRNHLGDESYILNKPKAKTLFEQYATYCNSSQWLTYRESYKFRFARWLNERVDFDSQSDAEILAICKASQEEQYDTDSTYKGLNFIRSALRFKDEFLTVPDVALIRRLYEGGELTNEDLSNSPLTYPKFSIWSATMLPERFEIYGSEELNTSIAHLFDLKGISTHGAEGFYLANKLLSEIRSNLMEHFEEEIKQLISHVFPQDPELRPVDIPWLVQDFTLYINRMILNYKPHYYWVNQGSSYRKEMQAGIIAAPAKGNHNHHNRLRELKKGDRFIHYSEGSIRAISVVSKEFIIGPRPYSLKEYSDKEVYVVEVNYEELKDPISLSEVQAALENNWDLVPKKNAPFDRNKNIKQGYCFEFSQEAFNRLFNKDVDLSMKQYWLYAPGENARKWDEFYQEGIMALGWDDLGDLNRYKSKEEIVERLQELENTTSSKKNDATANDEFIREMNVGDVVFVKQGISKLLGYGVIASDYRFDNSREEYKHVRDVTWEKKGVWAAGHNLALKTLTNITKYESPETSHRFYYQRLMAIINDERFPTEKSNATLMDQTKNIILYGPPGTGKTYNTINMSLEICDGIFTGLSREQMKMHYNDRVESGQIVFTTFHQSMSYEDFIEGIKPIEPEEEGGQVIYKVVDGIFKKACVEAAFNYATEHTSDQTEKQLDFSLTYDRYAEQIQERLTSEGEIPLKTRSGGEVFVDSITSQGNILIKHKDGSRVYTVSKPRLSKLQKAISNLDEVNNINDTFRQIIGGSNSSAFWAVLNDIRQNQNGFQEEEITNKVYSYEDKKEVVESLNSQTYKGKNAKPVVVIIDEINRGNISSIFGELITLLESDKRLGQTEELTSLLPYSKEQFGVPPNVFIIGTMNTADRSVEALDTALRRRFSFVEMMPKPELLHPVVEGIVLRDLLQLINTRIEQLVDRDHTIGHSYFINVKTPADLAEAFNNKVVPLLQEYFYGDFGKIGLVLGEGFVKRRDNNSVNFAEFYYPDQDDFKNETYALIHQTGESIIPALRQTLGVDLSQETHPID